MKRNILTAMVLLLAASIFNSCSKDVFNDNRNKSKEQVVDAFKVSFLNYVGGSISPDQDWGFSTQTANRTRGYENGYYITDDYSPEYFTKDFYLAVSRQLPEGKPTAAPTNFEFLSRGPIRFAIICSNTSSADEIGYYFYNPETQSAEDRQEVKLVDNIQNIAYYYQYDISKDEGRPMWLAPDPRAGYSTWTKDITTRSRAKMFTIETGNVPAGYRVGFYLKNNTEGTAKVYTNKYLNPEEKGFCALLNETGEVTLNNSYVVGLGDRVKYSDYDCNDVIIAVMKHVEPTYPLVVIPEKKVHPYSRIIAEDLRVEDATDFDFNDIVLDVCLEPKATHCILQAAGATQAIRINGDDNLEVHKLFGVAQGVMVNTRAASKGLRGAELDPVSFTIDQVFSNADQVKIEVNKGTAANPLWIELFAAKGEPACKMCLTTDFKWTDEREDLKVAYPHFVDWVKDPTVKWY